MSREADPLQNAEKKLKQLMSDEKFEASNCFPPVTLGPLSTWTAGSGSYWEYLQ